jgi:phytol kinase
MYFAALVPLTITLQFFLVGIGVLRDKSAVQAMSRTGDPREILRGPLYYGLVFVLITVIFWYNSPTGIVALMLMCGGDGLADILGRRYGKTHIPWNPRKSWIGSLAMFSGGFIFSSIILGIFISMGIFDSTLIELFPTLMIISVLATIVETLPLKDIDNITVTATAILLGYFLF